MNKLYSPQQKIKSRNKQNDFKTYQKVSQRLLQRRKQIKMSTDGALADNFPQPGNRSLRPLLLDSNP